MFIFKLFILAFFLMPGGEEWQRVETPYSISFLLPNSPQKLTKETNGILSEVYQTKDLTCVFGVVCSDLSKSPVKLTEQNAQDFYEQMRKGSLSVETAILKDEKTIPLENMLVKEIEYSIIKDNYQMTFFKRFIFRDNMVYQISIGGRSRHRSMLLAAREIFFNSVQFK